MAARALSYTAFCAELRIRLEPGQNVLCTVAFDGVDPCDLPADQRAIAAELFGPDVHRVPSAARDVIVVVIGGRAGKSYLLCGIRMLHLACTAPLDGLAPGEVASANLVAPDLDLAQQTLSYVAGAARAHPALARMVVSDTSEGLVLQRGDRRVAIKPRAASGKGRTGRGRSLVGFAMDEAAIFLDSDHKVNDEAIYKANVPRVMRGGQSVIATTPWGKDGLVYELWRDNWNLPGTCLVAHAPTTRLRTDAHVLAQVAAEYARDAENADREFGAKFMASGTSRFFDEESILRSISPDAGLGQLPRPGDVVLAGADPGFVSDHATLVIGHRRGGVCTVAEMLDKAPEPGKPLKPSEVFGDFVVVVKRHGAAGVMTDSHYRESFREATDAGKLVLLDAPEGAAGNEETHVKCRALMREGRLKIPDDPKLLRQLRAVLSRPASGGRIAIVYPRGPGGHCDQVSALAKMAYQAYGPTTPAPEPEEGSEAWKAKQGLDLVAHLAARHRQAERDRGELYGLGSDD